MQRMLSYWPSQSKTSIMYWQVAAECKSVGMKISTPKSEAMFLDWKRVVCPLKGVGEVMPQDLVHK